MAVPPPPPSEITPSILPGHQLGHEHGHRLCHRFHAFASVAPVENRLKIDAPGSSHLETGDRRAYFRFTAGAYVNEDHIVSAGTDLLRHKDMLRSLGVEGSENRNSGHRYFRLTGMDLNSRVRLVRDSSTAMRSRLEAPTKPTASVCSLM